MNSLFCRGRLFVRRKDVAAYSREISERRIIGRFVNPISRLLIGEVKLRPAVRAIKKEYSALVKKAVTKHEKAALKKEMKEKIVRVKEETFGLGEDYDIMNLY